LARHFTDEFCFCLRYIFHIGLPKEAAVLALDHIQIGSDSQSLPKVKRLPGRSPPEKASDFLVGR
jgi:hypothetical protein